MKQVKILFLLLALIFSVGILAACGSQEAVNTNSEATHQTTSTNTDSFGSGSKEIFDVPITSLTEVKSEVESSTDSVDGIASETDTHSTDNEESVSTKHSQSKYPTLPKKYWVEDPNQKFGEDVVCVWMQPSEKNIRDYTISDFPEVEFVDIWYTQRIDSTPCIMLTLKNPSKENVVSAIKTLEKRADIYKVAPECDTELISVDIPEEATFFDDRVILVVQPSARQHIYKIEDFPEIECISVVERMVGPIKNITLTLKTPSKENVIAAVRLLEKREDMVEVHPSWYVLGADATADGFPDLDPDDSSFVGGD